jgi:hypothetical protein
LSRSRRLPSKMFMFVELIILVVLVAVVVIAIRPPRR